MKAVRILRVDPVRRTVAAMVLKAKRDCTPQVRQIIRSPRHAARQILIVPNAGTLHCIAGLDVDESMQGWRLRGADDTGGVGILTGRDGSDGLLIDVPVTRDWVLERIQWLDGEDVDSRQARAEEMIPSLATDMRVALAAAVVTPNGIWLSAAHRAVVGDAMQTLGLGTERSAGQQLTPLGEAVFDLLAKARG